MGAQLANCTSQIASNCKSCNADDRPHTSLDQEILKPNPDLVINDAAAVTGAPMLSSNSKNSPNEAKPTWQAKMREAGITSNERESAERNDRKQKLKDMVTKFVSEAQGAGIPCVFLNIVDGVLLLKVTSTLFLNEELTTVQLIPKKDTLKKVESRELPLASYVTLDYDRLHQLLPDNETIKVLAPEQHKLSAHFCSKEGTICVLLEDETKKAELVKCLKVLAERAKSVTAAAQPKKAPPPPDAAEAENSESLDWKASAALHEYKAPIILHSELKDFEARLRQTIACLVVPEDQSTSECTLKLIGEEGKEHSLVMSSDGEDFEMKIEDIHETVVSRSVKPTVWIVFKNQGHVILQFHNDQDLEHLVECINSLRSLALPRSQTKEP